VAAVGVHVVQAGQLKKTERSPGSSQSLVLGFPQDIIVRQQKPRLDAFVINILLFPGRPQPRRPW
jgi:hypothetical protein